MIRKMMITGMCVALLSGVASAAGEVMFTYKFEPGAAQHYRLKINTEMEMSGMEASQVADMTVTVTCGSAKKDTYAMTLRFDKAEASNVIAGNMQADPLAAQMVGKTVTFDVDIHGTVTAITPGPNFDAWPQVQQVVEPTLKNWYVYLPAKAVPVGGEWKRDNFRDKSAAGSEFVSNEHFKFREVKKDKGRDLAVVDEDVTTDVGGSTETPVGVFDVKGKGKGKFEFNFDPARGAILYFKGTMNTDIDMTPQAGGLPMKTSVANHIERQLLD
jgi:hypothetical protein